ncbi:MAG: chaperone modulator CbpM [Burkholderiaceae bacterium]|jgi:chaperone modulatory protein CbpM
MRVEIVHTVGIEELRHYSLGEIAESSGLSIIEIRELTEIGILEPVDSAGQQGVFSGTSLRVAQATRRLKVDFELDAHGAALAVQLLERIRELEQEVRFLKARSAR